MTHSRCAGAGPAIIVATLLFAACGGDATEPGPIDSVVIVAQGGGALEVLRGGTLRLDATAYRAGSAVSGVVFNWVSETPGIATVDGTGQVAGHAYGTAEIVATPVAGGASGRVTLPVVGPAVASIVVAPESAMVDIGDTVAFTATARSESGAALGGADFTWRTSSANATVDGQGRVVGVAPGPVTVEATAWNDVSGAAEATVTPVTAVAPDTGRYGAIVRIEGIGLPDDATVLFTGDGGSAVEAFVRSASATAYEVWVPVGARSGPLRFESAGQSFTTSRSFGLTAQEDVLGEGWCDFVSFCTGVLIPFPYENPSLVARSDRHDFFGIVVDEPTEFNFEVTQLGGPDPEVMIDARVLRLEPEPQVMMALIRGFNPLAGTALDVSRYARQVLEPGTYAMFVTARHEGPTVRKGYGVRIGAEAEFAVEPDAYEPNDFPQESPVVDLPFAESGLAIENGFAFDYFVFDVDEDGTTVTARTVASEGELDLYLLEGDTLDLFFGAQLVVVSAEDGPEEEITADLAAGRYTLMVAEYSGVPGTYSLEITVEPSATAASPFDLSPRAPAPRGLDRLLPDRLWNPRVKPRVAPSTR